MKYKNFASLQGKRPTNEDEHTIIIGKNLSFYAIFDGHGGGLVSKFLKKNLHKYFTGKKKPPFTKTYIDKAFTDAQNKIVKSLPRMSKLSGSTCLALIKYGKKVIIMNVGDCRAVLCRNGLAIPLTKDHKPNWPDEKKRIAKLGGEIYYDSYDWRVGTLSVSRAFGDMDTKPYITHKPDVFRLSLTKKDEFIVLACDGLWDVMCNQEVIQFIYEHPENTAKKLATYAINKKGSTDNVSVMIINTTF